MRRKANKREAARFSLVRVWSRSRGVSWEEVNASHSQIAGLTGAIVTGRSFGARGPHPLADPAYPAP